MKSTWQREAITAGLTASTPVRRSVKMSPHAVPSLCHFYDYLCAESPQLYDFPAKAEAYNYTLLYASI